MYSVEYFKRDLHVRLHICKRDEFFGKRDTYIWKEMCMYAKETYICAKDTYMYAKETYTYVCRVTSKENTLKETYTYVYVSFAYM